MAIGREVPCPVGWMDVVVVGGGRLPLDVLLYWGKVFGVFTTPGDKHHASTASPPLNT